MVHHQIITQPNGKRSAMPTHSTTRAFARSRPQPGFLRRLLHLAAVARARHDLARLDDRLLRDIGLTRDEADRELSRPVWDVPPHWRG
jgi:uncharacterized protein YjiS (DUF1127 family)